jgi:hypothetical protein
MDYLGGGDLLRDSPLFILNASAHKTHDMIQNWFCDVVVFLRSKAFYTLKHEATLHIKNSYGSKAYNPLASNQSIVAKLRL